MNERERFEIGVMKKDDDTVFRIDQVNDRLSPLGVRLSLEPSGNGDYLLTVRIRKNARHAGKPRISFLSHGISCSPAQIRAMIREEGADAVAKYLGCSRATLFRRLKESESDPSAFF